MVFLFSKTVTVFIVVTPLGSYYTDVFFSPFFVARKFFDVFVFYHSNALSDKIILSKKINANQYSSHRLKPKSFGSKSVVVMAEGSLSL